jgi:NAD(P)-dependent dehydrogenase (short-subunit alcohol dehydrogenase family)
MESSRARVAVVTGISRGFGRAVAALLLSHGWQVVGDGRDRGKLEAAHESTAGADGLHLVPGDILDEAHLATLIKTATRDEHGIDLLINNAGALGPSPLPSLKEANTDDLDLLFRTNAIAPLRLIQLALPSMANGGCVIDISSDAAVEHYPGWGPYGATKAALDLYTGVLGVEEPHVRFYALDPGDMRTDMHQAAFPAEDISDRAEPTDRAPAVLLLVDSELPSGRYRAEELLS